MPSPAVSFYSLSPSAVIDSETIPQFLFLAPILLDSFVPGCPPWVTARWPNIEGRKKIWTNRFLYFWFLKHLSLGSEADDRRELDHGDKLEETETVLAANKVKRDQLQLLGCKLVATRQRLDELMAIKEKAEKTVQDAQASDSDADSEEASTQELAEAEVTIMQNEVKAVPNEGEGGPKVEDGAEERKDDDENVKPTKRPSVFMESIGALGAAEIGDQDDGGDEDSYNAEEEQDALQEFADHLDAHFPIQVKIKDDPTHAQDQEEVDQLGETKVIISDMDQLDVMIAELEMPLARLRDELDVLAEMYIQDHHHNEARDGPKTVFPDLGPMFFHPGWGLQVHDLEKGLDQNSKAYRRARNLQLYSQQIKTSATGLSQRITMDIKALEESASIDSIFSTAQCSHHTHPSHPSHDEHVMEWVTREHNAHTNMQRSHSLRFEVLNKSADSSPREVLSAHQDQKGRWVCLHTRRHEHKHTRIRVRACAHISIVLQLTAWIWEETGTIARLRTQSFQKWRFSYVSIQGPFCLCICFMCFCCYV